MLLSEYGEVDAAVLAVLYEAGVLGEVVVFAMLKDEDSVLGKEVLLEDEVGDGGKFTQCVWRVGKNEVELLLA